MSNSLFHFIVCTTIIQHSESSLAKWNPSLNLKVEKALPAPARHSPNMTCFKSFNQEHINPPYYLLIIAATPSFIPALSNCFFDGSEFLVILINFHCQFSARRLITVYGWRGNHSKPDWDLNAFTMVDVNVGVGGGRWVSLRATLDHYSPSILSAFGMRPLRHPRL